MSRMTTATTTTAKRQNEQLH